MLREGVGRVGRVSVRSTVVGFEKIQPTSSRNTTFSFGHSREPEKNHQTSKHRSLHFDKEASEWGAR